MRLATVRPGDMIRAGDLHGVVIEKLRGKVKLRGVCNHAIRTIHADEIDQHWRLAHPKPQRGT